MTNYDITKKAIDAAAKFGRFFAPQECLEQIALNLAVIADCLEGCEPKPKIGFAVGEKEGEIE